VSGSIEYHIFYSVILNIRPPPTPATPVRKAKPSTKKKALEDDEER